MTIPDNVTSIGTYAFSQSGLSEVYISETARSNLGLSFGTGKTFYGKTGVTIFDVYFLTNEPDDSWTFFTHTNGTVYPINIVGELVKNSYSSTISNSNIAEVQIGTNVTSIGDNTFYNCTALQSITIPDSVTSIAVSYTHLTLPTMIGV